MSVKSDDLDLDLDLDLGARAGPGSGAGPRYNTEDFCKLMPAAPAVKVPTLRYASDWDPEYRAWAYVHEFIVDGAWGGNTPIAAIRDDINSQNDFPVPAPALNKLDDAKMTAQVIGLLDASIDRADRVSEILDQATGQGALHYWIGLLRIDPAKDKNTFLLMLVARKIGEFVAMGLKDVYRMRRPGQVYPWIMPLIDGPDTPSYPSSHSLQAHLISGALKLALSTPVPPPNVAAGAPPSVSPFPPPLPAQYPETARALDELADRVATNREIAGVHYHMDSQAGRYAALVCLQKLNALGAGSAFQQLVAAAARELVDLP